MNTREMIDDFFAMDSLAVAGVSRKKEKTGNVIYRELKKSGRRVFGLNPHGAIVDGDSTYKEISDLPEPVQGMVVNTSPKQVPELIEQAAAAGVGSIWLQQGSESEEAIRLGHKKRIPVIHGYCLFMFLEPVTGFHRIHRWFSRLTGRLPR